jgi:hypothetical protein
VTAYPVTAYPHFLALIAFALAACADPAAQQAAHDREDARLQVLGDAVFYWHCEHEPVVVAGACGRWREAYEHDYAAFMARFGEAK